MIYEKGGNNHTSYSSGYRSRFNKYLNYFTAGKIKNCKREIEYDLAQSDDDNYNVGIINDLVSAGIRNTTIFTAIGGKMLNLAKIIGSTDGNHQSYYKIVALDITQYDIDSSPLKTYMTGHYLSGSYFREISSERNKEKRKLYSDKYWDEEYYDEMTFYSIATFDILSEIFVELGDFLFVNLNFHLLSYSYDSDIGKLSFGESQHLSSYAYIAQKTETGYTIVSEITNPIVQLVYVPAISFL